ncbi:hypothetical protein [Nocardioides sp.]|uniref:hypothetical protein n=1 Tax=Nocardioides sp. TaxID=35761 RepID=UPI003D0B2598
MAPTASVRLADGSIAARRGLLAGLLALPSPLRQRLAGPPAVLDGQLLDVDTQLVLRLQRLAREDGIERLPVGSGWMPSRG